MRSRILLIAAIAAGALTLSACSGGGSPAPGASGNDRPLAEGKVFTLALPADPGTLDPFITSVSSARWIGRFLYARLLERQTDGTILPGIATKWTSDATTATFTIRDDVTCEDGTPVTASDVAANIGFIGDPANGSPMVGVQVQPGTTAVGDDAAKTVTVTSGQPDAFLAENIGSVGIVCKNVLADPAARAKGKGATGSYTVTEIVPNSQYTLTRRADLAWGGGRWGGEAGGPSGDGCLPCRSERYDHREPAALR